MMRKIIKRGLVGAVLLTSLTANQIVHAHYDRAYWHEEETTTPYIEQYVDWMITLADYRRLSELSIPGTHDTMAYGQLPVSSIVQTQTMSLEQQLQSGIRYLDIRLAHKGDYFQLHHGSVDLGVSFEVVLDAITGFLQEYPSETILMRIKQEHTSESDGRMMALFNDYYAKYQDLFWKSEYSATPSNPSLAELRGKIVILSDVYSIRQGMSYRDIHKQDEYHLSTNWDLYGKWERIREHLETTNRGDPDSLYMNYLSGSGGVFPYFVASGHSSSDTYGSRLSTGLTEPGFKNYYPDFPRTARVGVFATIAFEGTNTLTADYLSKGGMSRAGIVVADFPGERLIDEIIQCNYR